VVTEDLVRALADTSVFVGFEAKRFVEERFHAYEWAVATVTLGELRLGLLRAGDPATASQRLSTYQLAQRFEPLPVDEGVAEAWALLVSQLRLAGRKAPVNDSWIAATAIRHQLPIVTQDADFDGMPGVDVIRV
jgi:predicted nucleic acid-binding protein